MARRALLQEDINLELLPLHEIAPISGFFTYGEFYHNCNNKNCNNQLLNQTMTLLAISESGIKNESVSPNIFSHNPPSVNDVALHRTQALSTLIEKTTKELEDLNNQLEMRVEKEVAKNIEKDTIMQMMQAQAQLGDMIEMILHQWRQPLSGISIATSSIQVCKMSDTLTDDALDKSLESILGYVSHLNDTINDFRDLFKTDINFTTILPSKLIDKALTVINPLLKNHSIELTIDLTDDSKITVPISLMMQVIINIVKNSIDILLEKDIKNPIIKFQAYIEKDMSIIKIIDNGGGIPVDILPKIFDKKFTTKGSTHGTGIGLDMSKTIIENKVGGKLTANNVDKCAVFTIEIPLN